MSYSIVPFGSVELIYYLIQIWRFTTSLRGFEVGLFISFIFCQIAIFFFIIIIIFSHGSSKIILAVLAIKNKKNFLLSYLLEDFLRVWAHWETLHYAQNFTKFLYTLSVFEIFFSLPFYTQVRIFFNFSHLHSVTHYIFKYDTLNLKQRGLIFAFLKKALVLACAC